MLRRQTQSRVRLRPSRKRIGGFVERTQPARGSGDPKKAAVRSTRHRNTSLSLLAGVVYCNVWMWWDTGLGDRIAANPNGEEHFGGRFSVNHTRKSQLQTLTLRPDDVRYVALSHFTPIIPETSPCFQRQRFFAPVARIQKNTHARVIIYNLPEDFASLPRLPKLPVIFFYESGDRRRSSTLRRVLMRSRPGLLV